MEMRGSTVSFTRTMGILADVSARNYSGNIVPSHVYVCAPLGKVNDPDYGVRIALWATDADGSGSRRAASGRRCHGACWHAHRDFLGAFFTAYPEAKVRTMLATYVGREGFLQTFEGTGKQTFGSVMQPVTMPELCKCE